MQAMKFLSCNNSSLSNIHFSSSPQTHALIFGCNGFNVSHVSVESRGDSPNTDGIHIHASHHLSITYSNITCGDDCISIGDYTSNIEINNVQCGPGHGISIGSLGKSGNFVQVEDIHVYNCTFNGTTNGARIKTWQASGVEINNVVYQNITGTARRETAINLNCSRSVPCTEIRMESIDITAQAASGTVAAYCSNARGQESVVEPGPCLQQL
nr:polygalacturonase QRT2-like [Ipomoea batatas]